VPIKSVAQPVIPVRLAAWVTILLVGELSCGASETLETFRALEDLQHLQAVEVGLCFATGTEFDTVARMLRCDELGKAVALEFSQLNNLRCVKRGSRILRPWVASFS
jgi:hypothetical protein